MVLLGVLAAAIAFFFALRPGELIPAAVADAGPPILAVVEDAGAEVAVDAGEIFVAEATLDAGPDEPELDAGTVAVIDPPTIKRPGLKKRGKVNVITTHGGEPYWAQVSVDGVPRGRTPLLLDLPLGRYQLLIERSGFRSLSREIRVASGRAVVVKLELVP